MSDEVVVKQKKEISKTLINLEIGTDENSVISRRNAITFCAFKGECNFKKLATKKNEHQPKTQCVICAWKDCCNQQIIRF